MSDESILIGYVQETYSPTRGEAWFRQANDAALAALPEEDAGPALARPMFSVTGHTGMQGSFRGRSLIHFGGNFNSIGEDLEEWLAKFEALLRRLYWYRAEVLTLSGYTGPPVRVRYTASPDALARFHSNDPRPPQTWGIEVSELERGTKPPNPFVEEWLNSLSDRAQPPQ